MTLTKLASFCTPSPQLLDPVAQIKSPARQKTTQSRPSKMIGRPGESFAEKVLNGLSVKTKRPSHHYGDRNDRESKSLTGPRNPSSLCLLALPFGKHQHRINEGRTSKKTFWLNLYSLVKEHLERFPVQTRHRRLAPAMPLLAVYRSDTLPAICMAGTLHLSCDREKIEEVLTKSLFGSLRVECLINPLERR